VKEKFLVLIGAHYSDLVELGGVRRSLVAGRLPRGRKAAPGGGRGPQRGSPGIPRGEGKNAPKCNITVKGWCFSGFLGLPKCNILKRPSVTLGGMTNGQ
jgi:hypothetical protein